MPSLRNLANTLPKSEKKGALAKIGYILNLNLARRTIDRLETGQVDPRATTLRKIAKTLEVPLSELVDI